MYQAPDQCPTCHSTLTTTELSCRTCGTRLQGEWASTPFSQLNADQQAFLILFVRSRGNLSEVERALGVSYPTVRGKLEEVIQVLADEEPIGAVDVHSTGLGRREVLERVARGEITPVEAITELRRREQSED